MATTGTVAARLTALDGKLPASQMPPERPATVDARLHALSIHQLPASDRFGSPVDLPAGPLQPASIEHKQQHPEQSPDHAVTHCKDKLVDTLEIGAAKAAGCGCHRNCLQFWSEQQILQYHVPESKRNHRERVRKLLKYVEHCQKTSRGYNQYIVEVRNSLTGLTSLRLF